MRLLQPCRRSYWTYLIAVLAVGLMVAACNKGGGDGRETSSPSLFESPTAASDPAPAPAQAPATASNLLVELLEQTFAEGRCTDLSQAPYNALSELIAKFKITNGLDSEAYSKPVIYHVPWRTCGAIDANSTNPDWPGVTGNFGAADMNVTGDKKIQAGQSGEVLYTFPLERRCGTYQFDDTWGPNATFVLGKVIMAAEECPDCTQFNLKVAVTGEGLTRTVTVTFKHPKGSKKAQVDFGDGTSAEFSNGQSVQHTWKYGEFHISAKLEDPDLPAPCEASATVNNQEPCRVEWKELEPEITYGEWGECKESDGPTASNNEQQCSQSRSVRTVIKEQNSCTEEIRVKSDKTDTESQPCDCPCEEGWVELKPEITYGEWGECEPTEAFGASTTQQSCSKSRSVRTIIKEKNTCTQEIRTKSDETTQESESCECPCQVEWIQQEPVRENETDWGACEPGEPTLFASTQTPPPTVDCPGHKSRYYDEVIYEVNSCTQERREKGRTTIEEQDKCTAQCEQPMCHTENKKYCGWLGCKNQWYIGSEIKWQCQNVPPGTPGHYPNHFGANGHNDFFGQCTQENCYNITN